MYKEDHRERITRADIQKRLKGKTIDLIFPILVIVIPIAFMSLFYLFNETLLSVFVAVISIISFIMLICYLVSAFKFRAEASRGNFTVTKTELQDTETVVRTVRRRRAIVDEHTKVFYFENGMSYSEKFNPDSPQKYFDSYNTRIAFSMEHSNSGDTFYVVTLDKDPDKIIMILSGVIFKYEE